MERASPLKDHETVKHLLQQSQGHQFESGLGRFFNFSNGSVAQSGSSARLIGFLDIVRSRVRITAEPFFLFLKKVVQISDNTLLLLTTKKTNVFF